MFQWNIVVIFGEKFEIGVFLAAAIPETVVIRELSPTKTKI